MSKFRKKPVVIEARRFESEADGSVLAEWCGGTNENSPEAIDIPTLEGTMRADLGDWIIQGVKGEFYPCKPDIFAATYDPVPLPIAAIVGRARLLGYRGSDSMSDDVAACEWASTIGDGLHVDMANAGGPWIATCCDVGEIDGPEGRPVLSGYTQTAREAQ